MATNLNQIMNNKIAFSALVIAVVIIIGTLSGLYAYDPGALGLNSASASCEAQNVNVAPTGAVVTNTTSTTTTTTPTPQNNGPIKIVAAENFWGNLVSQLGGDRVSVFSVITDPNTDPHEYQSSTADSREIANAQLVIVNGEGYDQWAIQEFDANGNSSQVLLNVQTLLGVANGENPHFWYSPYYVNQTVHAMYEDLVMIDPSHTSYYKQQYTNLNQSLAGPGSYMAQIGIIKSQFAGTKVAATESIFVYLANATGLNLISPPAFIEAVAEGNDPPLQSVAEFQNQLDNNSAKVLVYNMQTVTPLTQCMKSVAAAHQIPIVGVTESIQPPNASFQSWMLGEVYALQNALNQNALGQ